MADLSILDLPPEIIRKILGHFSDLKTRSRLLLVSREVNRLTREFYYIKELSVHFGGRGQEKHTLNGKRLPRMEIKDFRRFFRNFLENISVKVQKIALITAEDAISYYKFHEFLQDVCEWGEIYGWKISFLEAQFHTFSPYSKKPGIELDGAVRLFAPTLKSLKIYDGTLRDVSVSNPPFAAGKQFLEPALSAVSACHQLEELECMGLKLFSLENVKVLTEPPLPLRKLRLCPIRPEAANPEFSSALAKILFDLRGTLEEFELSSAKGFSMNLIEMDFSVVAGELSQLFLTNNRMGRVSLPKMKKFATFSRMVPDPQLLDIFPSLESVRTNAPPTLPEYLSLALEFLDRKAGGMEEQKLTVNFESPGHFSSFYCRNIVEGRGAKIRGEMLKRMILGKGAATVELKCRED